jgi:hypothetical protein
MAIKISERIIEEYLREEVKKIGGKAYKFISPGNDGVPDRMVVLPGGRISFVELKTIDGKLTVLQQKCINELRKLDFDVRVINSKDLVDSFIKEKQNVL